MRLFTILFALSFCFAAAFSEPTVLVSVAPYKFFVEKIGGPTVKVILMVPAGASAHTYEPTPKETLAASHADLWFLIGESFEPRAVKAIKSYNSKIVLVDLKQGVDLISDKGVTHHCHNPNCQDLHIWLSPREAKIQAQTIARTLETAFPENKSLYANNLKNFLEELDQLDRDIEKTLKPLKNRWILVSHPAYAYFARDYHLQQLPIEYEGKDPTPKQLTKVIQIAKDNHIKKIFVQIQYSSKGARLIADLIGAQVVNLDPYSENYFESMREIAQQIASQ